MTSLLDLSHLKTFEEMRQFDSDTFVMKGKGTWGFLPPTEEVFKVFRYINDNYKVTKILEIGFNAGHSTTYLLETFKDAVVHTIGPNPQHNMQTVMRKKYDNRFKFFKGLTKTVRFDLDNDYDFAFVDGSHKSPQVNIDLHVVCNQLKIPLVLMDNCDQSGVKRVVYNKYVNRDKTLEFNKSWTYEMTWHGKTKVNDLSLFIRK